MTRKIYAIISIAMLSGCSVFNPLPSVTPAQTMIDYDSTAELMSLPKPKGKISVSVYSFRDQTGQYKPQGNVSSFSTAVTQGATSILVQALSDSDWFAPVEREGLQNIITERKIINRAYAKSGGKKKLPSLKTASIILEGGIIGYDTNIRTGGACLEYFGIGASELFREDQISVYLRAVDVRTGRILLSVSTNKRVLSQEMSAGFFRYISYKKLAEAEIGYSTNEPMQQCVTQAIEKALSSLIIKGIKKGVWRTE